MENSRRGPGRPTLPPAQRRSRTVLVSMTEGEFQALQRLATSQDRKPSRVLRLALDALLYGPPEAPSGSLKGFGFE